MERDGEVKRETETDRDRDRDTEGGRDRVGEGGREEGNANHQERLRQSEMSLTCAYVDR